MRWQTASKVLLGALATAMLCSCFPSSSRTSGGDGGGGGGSSLTRVAVAGRVEKPAGSAVDPATLEVWSMADVARVQPNGQFASHAMVQGPAPLIAFDAANEVVFMGFFDPERPESGTLNGRSTALMVTYIAMGAAMASPGNRLAMYRELLNHPVVDTVAQLIHEAHQDGLTRLVDVLDSKGPQIKSALGTLVGERGRGIVVSPPESKSGILINQRDGNHIEVVNQYRRRVGYQVRKLYTQTTSDPASRVPQVGTTDLAQLGGVSGGTSTFQVLSDLFTTHSIFLPTTSPPIPTPPDEGAYKTVYRIYVGSIGLEEAQPEPDVSDPYNTNEIRNIGQIGLFFDMVFPTIATAVGPVLMSKGGFDGDDIFTLKEQLVSDTLALAAAMPTFVEAASRGDMPGAVSNLATQLTTSSTIRTMFLQILLGVPLGFAGQSDKLEGVLKAAGKILAAVDLTALAADWSLYFYQLSQSRVMDYWDIEVFPGTVKLSPEDAAVEFGKSQSYTASAPEFDAATHDIQYLWTLVGKATLTGPTDTGPNLTTTTPTVDLRGTEDSDSQASLAVEVKTRLKGSQEAFRTIGKAGVRVRLIQNRELDLRPRNMSVQPGGTLVLTAVAKGVFLPRFRFSLEGGLGTLSPSGTPQQSSLATFTAGSNEGSTQVVVEIFKSNEDGTSVSIGTARANILIEREPTFVAGTFETRIYSLGNDAFAGVGMVTWPGVAGAKRYEVLGYGGYDPAYFGSSVSLSVSPPNWNTLPDGSLLVNGHGLSSGTGYGDWVPSSVIPWLRSRFEGFTWEVKVIR